MFCQFKVQCVFTVDQHMIIPGRCCIYGQRINQVKTIITWCTNALTDFSIAGQVLIEIYFERIGLAFEPGDYVARAMTAVAIVSFHVEQNLFGIFAELSQLNMVNILKQRTLSYVRHMPKVFVRF